MPRRGSIAILPVALVLGLGASCGPVDPPPPSSIPPNACPPWSCEAYKTLYGMVTPTCSVNQCTSINSLDFTLVVSLPESSSTSLEDPPGVTIAIPRFTSYLQNRGNQCATDLSCAIIPAAARPGGSVTVDGATQACARRPIDGGAILPANVRLWPLWPPGSAVAVPAAAAGIPLLPVSARTSVDHLSAGSGPAGTPPTRWDAVVSPSPEVLYDEDIVPLDPSYPPTRLHATSAGGPQSQSPISVAPNECRPLPAPQPTTFNVARGNGSLDGFSVYFRDAAMRRRVSSLAALPDAASAQTRILTSGTWPPPSPAPELVVAPPAGTPIPTYADKIATVTGQLGPVNYPPLPTPMTVLGTVLGPDGGAIQADLVIDSTPPNGSTGGIVVCSSPDCTQSASTTTQRPLSYSTTAHAGGADGAFSVVLPPGTYDAFIIPAFGVNAGATSVTLGVQAVFQQGVPPVAAGKTLMAAARATIEGTVTLADGRALVGATVEAHAAVALAAGGKDPRRWPRAVSAVTDGAGSFSLSADPGMYDIVVRPQDGTGFPWLTITSRSVAAGGVLSFAPGAELVVPAPIFIPMTLQDESRSALVGALVRAYYPSSKAPPSSPPEVELGAWLTDSAGHVSMFIAPPQ